jgi:hypothetical protein
MSRYPTMAAKSPGRILATVSSYVEKCVEEQPSTWTRREVSNPIFGHAAAQGRRRRCWSSGSPIAGQAHPDCLGGA